GRMRDAIAPLHEQLGGHGPHLPFNGAEVRLDGRTIASWPLPAGAVDRLLSLVQHRDDAYLELYTDSGFVASALDERAAPHWEILGARPRTLITDAAELGTEPVLKATFTVFEPNAVTELIETVGSLGLVAGTAGSPLTPGLTYINATHPEADKGRALTHAADHLGIPLSQVVAVGDAPNDLSMFEVVGTAIAMGQADAAIHAAAHLAVPPVDQDGVVVALDTVGSWLAT
ncbi:MAG: HAD hydrolase family protein, partial [Actinomycetota bacterium]